MEKKVRFYSNKDLTLKSTNPGAKMWGVALEKTLLTYFEVEPQSTFKAHSHESEQITLVLEGELFFKVDGEEFCVGPGEVIAIPSFEEHAAFTRERAVKAVDAWSPIMEQYK